MRARWLWLSLLACGRTSPFGGAPLEPMSDPDPNGCGWRNLPCLSLHLTTPERVMGRVKIPGAVTVTDAVGETAVMPRDDGYFNATPRVRADREPTRICVRAAGCGDEATVCAVVRQRPEVELDWSLPPWGAVVAGRSITVDGALTAPAVRMALNGLPVMLSGGGMQFGVRDVPLASGLNVLTAQLTASAGTVDVTRLVVSAGPMRLRRVEVRAMLTNGGPQRESAEVGEVGDAGTSSEPLVRPHQGPVSYRLVDAAGAELFRGDLPGLAPIHVEHDLCPSLESSSTTVLVPEVPGAVALDVLHGGFVLGGSAF